MTPAKRGGGKKAEAALRESEEKFHTVADFTYDWELWLGPVEPPTTKVVGFLIHTPVCVPRVHRLTG